MSRSRKLDASTLVGLNDLPALGTAQAPVESSLEGVQLVARIPLDAIAPNPDQPRRTFDHDALDGLAESIRVRGVLQPILVRPVEAGRYEIVAGERRWRASRIAGLAAIPAIVDGVDADTSFEIAVIENMAREDLNPIEEARACAALRDRCGLSVAEIARRVERDRTSISHLIRLLDLPDAVLALIEAGALTEGHGRVLLRLSDFQDQKTVAASCHDGGWSVRQLEREVDRRLDNATRPAPEPPRGVTYQDPVDRDDDEVPSDETPEPTAVTPEPEEAPAPPVAPPAPPARESTGSADEAAVLLALEERLAPVFGPLPVKVLAKRRGAYDIVIACDDLAAVTELADRLSGGGS